MVFRIEGRGFASCGFARRIECWGLVLWFMNLLVLGKVIILIADYCSCASIIISGEGLWRQSCCICMIVT